MSKVIIKGGKVIVNDEDQWITIKGAHVLIGENGEVKGGAGGALKGRKLSGAKSTGGKSSGESTVDKERDEASKKLKQELTRINTARQKYSNSITEQTDEDDKILEGFEREREKAYAERAAAEKRIWKNEYEKAFKAYTAFTEKGGGGMRVQYPDKAQRMKAMKAAKERVTKAEKEYMKALDREKE